uniref:Flavanone 4-reductase n=1 Tax=Chenopodium quinoa TaxID=63459 RepID=A0A803MUN6_CHEQI
MVVQGEIVCVTGAAGFIGSWLIKRLLEHGYIVRATVRDPGNMKKVQHLLDLPNATTHLTLWKADLNEEGSFDEAINGCTGTFHVATPMDFDSNDPENEVIKPTINGMLDIMKSCIKAKIRRLVFTSSAGTVNMYFVSKTLAEKAAWKFAAENNLDFISIIPPLVVGPFITPTMPPSLITALSPITRNEAHYSIIKQGQFVHLDDLCMAHIYLYEHPKAEGRYIASACDATIYDIGKMLREEYPEYNIPTKYVAITPYDVFGFSSYWIHIIHQRVSTVSYQVLVNGNPSPAFQPQYGIRQEDPLSSYLFVLCMYGSSLYYAQKGRKTNLSIL